jgi:hypothetical protein
MIKKNHRSPTKKAAPPEDKKQVISAEVFGSTAEELEHLADEQGTTTEAILHEAIGLLFRQHGVRLPSALVRHLENHGRPVPSASRRKPKAHDRN